VIALHLLAHAEKLAPNTSLNLGSPLLYHQVRTYEALGSHRLVVNCYDTGTGKTRAALLGLLHPDLSGANCLFVAPTNELLRQHERDIRDFLAAHHLDYHVIRVDAATLRALPQAHEYERVGQRLTQLFADPRAYGWDGRKALVVVINPDIFYYALYFSGYNRHDRRNLFEQFLTRFNYIIVDEFHYYNPKQLANLMFFFVIGQEWGYFDKGRRVCLLSATPEEPVREYLARVFTQPGTIGWVTPADEPMESEHYATVPTVAPLSLAIGDQTLDEFVDTPEQRQLLARWLDAGQDGALISNALWRINQAQSTLVQHGFRGRVSRLTGAETAQSRANAQNAPLILATPTVDIGYNFARPGKLRQPLDFVVFDARTRDEFVQRLGRAGRVLGREETNLPSQAIALIDGEALAALRHLDGQSLSRAELRSAVQQVLPSRNDLFAYVRSYAVLEAFRPIYEVKRMMRPDLEEWVERLFAGVLQAFAPGSRRWYYGTLCRRMACHAEMGRVVREEDWPKLSAFVDEFLDWHRPMGAPEPEWARLEEAVRTDALVRRQLVVPWLKAQYHLTESLFSFRDSFQGPTAAVYDPKHLLSDNDQTVYDALHVASNFSADYFDDPAAFRRACGVEPEPAQVHCRLTGHLEPRLRIGLDYREERQSRETWENLYTRRPVALTGLRLWAAEPGGAPAMLHGTVRRSIESQYVACLIVRDADVGRLLYLTRDRNLFPRVLRVTFAVDGTVHEYRVLLGTAAFTVHAELEGYFRMRQRRDDSAPVFL